MVVLIISLILLCILFFEKKLIINNAVIETFQKIKCRENHTNYLESNVDIDDFFHGAPYNGNYINYLDYVSKQTIIFLKRPELRYLIGKTIVVDIDDTLVYTRPYYQKSKKIEHHQKYGDVVHYEGIHPIVNLIKYAVKLGYHIVVITSRPPESYKNSLSNLHRLGIYPDALFTSLYWKQDPTFKSVMRNNLEWLQLKDIRKITSEQLFNYKPKKNEPKNLLNLKLVLSIGDKWHDITRMKNTLGLKLPDDSDMNSYFWFNGESRKIE